MRSFNLLELLLNSSITTVVIAIVIFLLRKYIVNYIGYSVQHKFDKKLEEFRSSLKRTEEDQAFIRNTVLTTMSKNDNLVKPQQLNAINELWQGFMILKKAIFLVNMVAVLNTKEIGKNIHDPEIKSFINTFKSEELQKYAAEAHIKAGAVKPWVSPTVWALYMTYEAIVGYVITLISTLAIGVDPSRYITNEKIPSLLQATVDENIKSVENAEFPQYLNIIENKLVIELQKEIVGKDSNQENIEWAWRVAKMAEEINLAAKASTDQNKVK